MKTHELNSPMTKPAETLWTSVADPNAPAMLEFAKMSKAIEQMTPEDLAAMMARVREELDRTLPALLKPYQTPRCRWTW